MIFLLLACKNPTPPEPPHCAGETHDGDGVASELPSDVRWVTGSLVLDAPSDVCGVAGDLEFREGGAAVELLEVRGALRIAEAVEDVELPQLGLLGQLVTESESLRSLRLPHLTDVGPIELRQMSALETVDLTAIERVVGRLLIIDLPLLDRLALEPLEQVDGPFVLRRTGVSELILPDAAHFEGGLELDVLPALNRVEGCGSCTSGGAIRLSGAARTVFTGFSSIESARSVEILDLPILERLDVFGALRHVDGVLRVDRVGPVQQLELFGAVETVGGSVVVEEFRGQRVVGFPSLRAVQGVLEISQNQDLEEIRLGQVRHVGSLVVHDNPALPALSELPQLEELGTVEIYDNVMLSSLVGLDGVEELRGGLRLERLPMLTDLSPLSALQSVDGDLRVVDIGVPREQVEVFFSGVAVSGTVRFE